MGLRPEEAVSLQTTDDYMIKLQEKSDEAYRLARKYLRASAERRKADYDIRVREEKFAVGSWVWLWYPRRYQSRSAKWQLLVRGGVFDKY